MTPCSVLLHPADTVAIALRDLPAGLQATESYGALSVRTGVPAGHKVAIRDLAEGATVYKFGQEIGRATRAIAAGDHVHAHNLEFAEGERDYAFGADAGRSPATELWGPTTFDGIVRDEAASRRATTSASSRR